MKAKWTATGQEEIFVDTKTIPIIKKKVAPIITQEEYESRRLWKDLTLALKIGNVDLATSTKSKIEQRQRDLVKERQESGIKWQRRVRTDLLFTTFSFSFTSTVICLLCLPPPLHLCIICLTLTLHSRILLCFFSLCVFRPFLLCPFLGKNKTRKQRHK